MLVHYKRNKMLACYDSDNLITIDRPEPIDRPRGPFDSCGYCSYARHGFVCYSAEGDCMKTDLQRLERRRKAVKSYVTAKTAQT